MVLTCFNHYGSCGKPSNQHNKPSPGTWGCDFNRVGLWQVAHINVYIWYFWIQPWRSQFVFRRGARFCLFSPKMIKHASSWWWWHVDTWVTRQPRLVISACWKFFETRNLDLRWGCWNRFATSAGSIWLTTSRELQHRSRHRGAFNRFAPHVFKKGRG